MKKEVLPGGTESPNWHFDYMYSKSIDQDQTRRKSSFGETVNADQDQFGAWYWLRAAYSSSVNAVCVVDGGGNMNDNVVSSTYSTAPSFCFNLG